MMQDLQVALIQTELHWENIPANLDHFSKKLEELDNSRDLILLPEMFSTGFTMNTGKSAETMEGSAVNWMKVNAERKRAVIAGSLVISENQSFYNRLIVAFPDGRLEHYDKRHLFRMADEHHHFSAGKTKKIIEVNGWKINLQVCYDLRFPVWSRNTFEKIDDKEAKAAYDICMYVANWPKARVNAWDTLLKARSIENQCYTLGLNRIGIDGSEVVYNGHSQIIDPKGEVVIQAAEGEEEVIRASLSYDELDAFRKKFPVGLDAD